MLQLVTMLAASTPPSLVAQDVSTLDPRIRFVTTGGAWRVGTSHGYMRLIVLDPGPSVAGTRLVIQWIEVREDATVLRDSRAVSAIGAPWRLAEPRFGRSSSWIRATVTGTDGTGGREQTWLIAVGPPGQFSVGVPRP